MVYFVCKNENKPERGMTWGVGIEGMTWTGWSIQIPPPVAGSESSPPGRQNGVDYEYSAKKIIVSFFFHQYLQDRS